jgi:hypothetical protein
MAAQTAARSCRPIIRRCSRPVPKLTIETGIEAMTLAVLSAFDQHARRK